MKIYLTLFYIITYSLSSISFAQENVETNKIESLKKEIEQHEQAIISINKSIDSLKLIVTKKKYEALDGKGFPCEVFMEGKLKDEPTVFGKEIMTIPSGKEVMIIEYIAKSNGYFKVLFEDKIGYLNDLYLKSFPEKEELKKIGKEFQSKNKATEKPSKSYTKPKKNYTTYHSGPRGGCYYYNSSGHKQYVDRSYCN